MDKDTLRAELDGRLYGSTSGADGRDVVLMCIDCVNPQLAAFALDFSRRGCEFDQVLLLSHEKPAVLPQGIDFQPISRLATKDAYNLFCLRDLHRYVEAPCALTIQTDGFLLRPERFSRDFLKFDFNGAPWPANKPYAVKSRVGNSGCCLRSLDLLEWTAKLATDRRLERHRAHYGMIFDDLFTGWEVYGDLMAQGMNFAPVEVAAEFSVELPTEYGSGLGSCVGFHGVFHYPTTWLRDRLGAWMNNQKNAEVASGSN